MWIQRVSVVKVRVIECEVLPFVSTLGRLRHSPRFTIFQLSEVVTFKLKSGFLSTASLLSWQRLSQLARVEWAYVRSAMSPTLKLAAHSVMVPPPPTCMTVFSLCSVFWPSQLLRLVLSTSGNGTFVKSELNGNSWECFVLLVFISCTEPLGVNFLQHSNSPEQFTPWSRMKRLLDSHVRVIRDI